MNHLNTLATMLAVSLMTYFVYFAMTADITSLERFVVVSVYLIFIFIGLVKLCLK